MKKLTVRTLAILVILALLCLPVSAARELIPGGQVIGLALSEGSLTVVQLHRELGKNAQAAGLKAGDKLTTLNGDPVTSLEQVRAIMDTDPQTVRLQILHQIARRTEYLVRTYLYAQLAGSTMLGHVLGTE